MFQDSTFRKNDGDVSCLFFSFKLRMGAPYKSIRRFRTIGCCFMFLTGNCDWIDWHQFWNIRTLGLFSLFYTKMRGHLDWNSHGMLFFFLNRFYNKIQGRLGLVFFWSAAATASSKIFFRFSPVRAEHSTNLAARIFLANFWPSAVDIWKLNRSSVNRLRNMALFNDKTLTQDPGWLLWRLSVFVATNTTGVSGQ